MKKNTTAKNRTTKVLSKTDKKAIWKMAGQQRLTIGLDLGDRKSRYCILNAAGDVVAEDELPTSEPGLSAVFEKMPSSRIALEVGTHSPWVSRMLARFSHEVIVANARKVALITQSSSKNDRLDAEQLARLARVDVKLLSPIQHRSEEAQRDLVVLRARHDVVEARTKLLLSARGLAKSCGRRLPRCESEQTGPDLTATCPAELQEALCPMLEAVERLSGAIAAYDEQIAEMEKKYPEVMLLKQVYGVGTLIALTYVLTIEDPDRFKHSRVVGAYIGLRPKQRSSGASNPELGITKEGDKLLRALLVQGAHTILRRGAPDSDLRAWAVRKLGGDGKQVSKRLKKKVVIAIARKLAVLLHRLWSTGEVYDPFYNRKREQSAAAA